TRLVADFCERRPVQEICRRRHQAHRRHHRFSRHQEQIIVGCMNAKPAEFILSVSVLALGIGVAVGASQLSGAGGYARVGPNAAPAVIAGGLILLGLWLAYEAFSGGWRNAIP